MTADRNLIFVTKIFVSRDFSKLFMLMHTNEISIFDFFLRLFSLRDAARATFSFPFFFSFRLSETEGGGKRSGKKDESFRIPKTAEFRSATSSAIRNDACTSFVLLAFARPPLEYVNPRIHKHVSEHAMQQCVHNA